MDIYNALYISLIVCILISAIINMRLQFKLEELKHSYYKESMRNRFLESDMNALMIENQIHKSFTKKSLDDVSIKLITLAVGNPNDNEARNAAMKACQRIHKNLK